MRPQTAVEFLTAELARAKKKADRTHGAYMKAFELKAENAEWLWCDHERACEPLPVLKALLRRARREAKR